MLRDHEAMGAGRGFTPASSAHPDHHKAYYPGRRGAKIAQRVDIYAALFYDMTVDVVSDLDLSYTPPG